MAPLLEERGADRLVLERERGGRKHLLVVEIRQVKTDIAMLIWAIVIYLGKQARQAALIALDNGVILRTV